MFDYCTSGSATPSPPANLRIRTARCLERFPDVLGLLEANEVNSSTISQVSKILTPRTGARSSPGSGTSPSARSRRSSRSTIPAPRCPEIACERSSCGFR